MKKNLIIIISAFIACIIFNCCENCSSYNDYYVISETKPYFDVYKEGNWWVYQNQDSTKKDSIFITNYYDKLWDVDRENCNRYEHREFILNSKNLFYNHQAKVRYGTDGCCKVFFWIEDGGLLSIDYKKDKNYFTYSGKYLRATVIPEEKINKNNFKNIIKVVGSPNPNNLDSIVFHFGEYAGLVRYIYQKDTFSLTNYYIK